MLYGGAFLLAGFVLVAAMYLLVRDHLRPRGDVLGMARTATKVPPPGPAFERRLPDGAVLIESVENFLDATLRSLLWQSAVVLLVVTALAVGLGWLLAGRALTPLQRVTETAQRVSARGLHERIALTGPDDEVKRLADTFDAMLERLDRAFDAQRRFVANASHELRTPLAINRTLLEVAAGDPDAGEDLRRLAPTLLATNARSEALIDGLLVLARSEQTLRDARPVDLAKIVREAVDGIAASAGRGIDIGLDLGPATVSGEPVLLERLVTNLVSNAIRHNVPGGRVEVLTRWSDSGVVLSVSNTGPVIPEQDVESLFEPFRRGVDRVAADGGAGLGLSIVRAVATAHGGTAHARPKEGGGLHVRVDLPA